MDRLYLGFAKVCFHLGEEGHNKQKILSQTLLLFCFFLQNVPWQQTKQQRLQYQNQQQTIARHTQSK